MPTPAATVAFTWGGDEVVRAWDLRRVACHAYTCSTGNNNATDIDWHAPTASLLVATSNPHAASYGRYGRAYRYGDVASDSEDETQGAGTDSYWPKGAKHGASFFPLRYDCTQHSMGYRMVLQYAFENGSTHMLQPHR